MPPLSRQCWNGACPALRPHRGGAASLLSAHILRAETASPSEPFPQSACRSVARRSVLLDGVVSVAPSLVRFHHEVIRICQGPNHHQASASRHPVRMVWELATPYGARRGLVVKCPRRFANPVNRKRHTVVSNRQCVAFSDAKVYLSVLA